MSLIFTLGEQLPIIDTPDIVSITGEQVLIYGRSFNQNILQVSGQDIYNSSNYFNVYGLKDQNISGIDNTLYLDTIGFTIPTGIQKTKYNLSVFNGRGKSSNSIELNVLNNPIILGLEKASGLPDEYIRVTGNYFYPAPNLFFIDSRNNKIFPSDQKSGLYRITGYELTNVGTGYVSGNKLSIDSRYNKLFTSTSSGVLEVQTTGISGSIADLNILNSGLFTIISSEINTNSQINVGNDTNIILNYEKFEYTGLDHFIEFKIPRNITKNQAIFIENLKYKAPVNLTINTISSSKTGFQVLGNPKIHFIDPLTGYNDEGFIRVSGDNLTYVTGLNLGSIKNISFNYDGEDLTFQIPYLADNNKVNVVTPFGEDSSDATLQILYRGLEPSGFNPNDVLLSGGLISISGKNLHRINYIDLGQQKINRENITVSYSTGSSHQASFILPENYITNEIFAYSFDYPNSGTKVISPNTNDKLIASVRLNTDLINLRYLSGIQAAKYFDEVEIYTPVAYSGDYGNLTNSEIFFNTPTGKSNITGCYTVSGIKLDNTSTGIRIRIPREIQNPKAQIKVKRNRFGDEYILSSNKSFDILPTIIYNPISNTTTNAQGETIISGINASSANQLFFSGNSGTTNIFGFKNIEKIRIDILDKQISGITGGLGPDYTYFKAKLGGDVRGTGKLFLFNSYYDTGIGYENNILSSSNVIVNPIEGFRPQNSPIFTSPSFTTSPLDEPFVYQIQTNSRATSFQIKATTISGVDDGAIFPPGVSETLSVNNQIYGFPESGGRYYIKIKAIDGDFPNEGMILETAFGVSGRSISSPGIVYRGVWSTGVAYIGNNLRRDVVKYSIPGTNYWYAGKSNFDVTPGPTNDKWIPFTNEFNATATQILLAERSSITSELNIGELGVLSGYIKSTNDSTVDVGSGFFLGFDNSYNPGKPKFRVGTTGAYIKFDGEGLNIFGPLSGIVTSSRKIIDANNIVDSEYSVALGLNNTIETGSDHSIAIGINNLVHENTDNSFIFGKDNIITGGRGLVISAGTNNLISGNSNFLSLDSAILGGIDNQLIGSYSNIVGGKGNYVDAVTSGYLVRIGELLSSDNLKITGSTGRYVDFRETAEAKKFQTVRVDYINNYYSSRGLLAVITQTRLNPLDGFYYTGYTGSYILSSGVSGIIKLQSPFLGTSPTTFIANRDNFGYNLSVFNHTGSSGDVGGPYIAGNPSTGYYYDLNFSLDNIVCHETNSLLSGFFSKSNPYGFGNRENIEIKVVITGLNTGTMARNTAPRFGSSVLPNRYGSVYIPFKTPFNITHPNDTCAIIYDIFGSGTNQLDVPSNFKNQIYPLQHPDKNILGSGFIENVGDSYYKWNFTSGTRGSGFWFGFTDDIFGQWSGRDPRLTGVFIIAKTGFYESISNTYKNSYIEISSGPITGGAVSRPFSNSPLEVKKKNYNFFYDITTGDNYKIYARVYSIILSSGSPDLEYGVTGFTWYNFETSTVVREPEYKIDFIASTRNTGTNLAAQTGILILPHDTSSVLLTNKSITPSQNDPITRYITQSGFILPLSGFNYNKNSVPAKPSAFELIRVDNQYSNYGISTGFFNAVKCNENIEDILNIKFSVILQAPPSGIVSGINESVPVQRTRTGVAGYLATSSISGNWIKRNFYVTVAKSGVNSTSWEDLGVTSYNEWRTWYPSLFNSYYWGEGWMDDLFSAEARMFNNIDNRNTGIYQNAGYTFDTGARPIFQWAFIGGELAHTGILNPIGNRPTTGALWDSLLYNDSNLYNGFWITGAKSGDVFKLTCQLFGGLGVVKSGINPSNVNQITFNNPLQKIPVNSGNNCLIFNPTINISQYPKNKFFLLKRGNPFTGSEAEAEKNYKDNVSPTGFVITDSIGTPVGTGRVIGDTKVDYIATKNITDLYAQSSQYIVSRALEVGFDDVGSSSIVGGTGNYIRGFVNSIGGGVRNNIIGDYNTIPGGRSNAIIDVQPLLAPKVVFSTILGGNNNIISGNVTDGAIIGGEYNIIRNDNKIDDFQNIGASIIGGKNNILSGSYSAIIGGSDNSVIAPYSYAFGRNTVSARSGSMILADGSSSAKTNFIFGMTENSLALMFSSGTHIRLNTAAAATSGVSPLIFGVLEIPTVQNNAPIGGIWRSGNVLCIRTS